MNPSSQRMEARGRPQVKPGWAVRRTFRTRVTKSTRTEAGEQEGSRGARGKKAIQRTYQQTQPIEQTSIVLTQRLTTAENLAPEPAVQCTQNKLGSAIHTIKCTTAMGGASARGWKHTSCETPVDPRGPQNPPTTPLQARIHACMHACMNKRFHDTCIQDPCMRVRIIRRTNIHTRHTCVRFDMFASAEGSAVPQPRPLAGLCHQLAPVARGRLAQSLMRASQTMHMSNGRCSYTQSRTVLLI